MKFCSQCGATVTLRIPAGDNLPRHVCDACNAIHYQNPRIIAGCIPVWNDQVLLCRRAIEPRYGLWTLPAGFMENRETTLEAAARESFEEAGARLDDMQFFCSFSIPHISQVYIMYRGVLRDGHAQPGEESLDVALYDEGDIPWGEIAFPVVKETLRLYFADRARGEFVVHTGDIIRNDDELTVLLY